MSEIDELRATVDMLAARVRALADQVEIMQLVTRYGPAVDSRSGEAAAALWTGDGTFDAVPHLRMRGRDDIQRARRGAVPPGLRSERRRSERRGKAVPLQCPGGELSRHAAMVGEGHQSLITNGCGHILTVPHIVVDGDQATGRSHALNVRWDAAAGRFWVARVSANTWRWVRTPEGWRIAERVNASLDGTAEHRDMLAPPR